MSYFKASVGQRPESADKSPEKRPAAPKTATPYFASRLGPKRTVGDEPTDSPPTACPLCRAGLAEKDGVYHCRGRCGSRWLALAGGQVVDVAALPWGICACCQPPQALSETAQGAVCPRSGQGYLLLAEGPVPLAEAAPEGLCLCCQPPLPLVWREEQLVCQAKPYHAYERQGDHLALLSPTPSATAAADTLEAIDQALRRNSARLTVNGLFDME